MPLKASTKKPRNARLASTLVSALKKKAAAVVRKAVAKRPMARARSTSPAARPPAAKPSPRPRVIRRSIVRKPARGPTVRAAQPRPSPAKSAQRGAPAIEKPRAKRRAAAFEAMRRPAMSLSAPPQPFSPPASSGGGQAPSPAFEETFAIPAGYGEDRIVLMVKDPWWLYAYWEIQPATERAARSQLLPHEVADLSSVLRVYDVTDADFPAQPAHGFFDIPLSGLATNWYIEVSKPNRSFVVEIGLLTRQGRFLLLARSNRVTTPRFGPSDVFDEEWMVSDEDYWKLFGMTAGIGMGASPTALKKFMEQLPSSALFSPGAFSPGMFSPVKQQRARAFWLRVDAELIVYGATDPKAAVTIQGQPVALRDDGTFSVRMALPDGTQTIPVEATSPDHVETRTITPIVTRRTERSETLRESTDASRPAPSKQPNPVSS